MASTPGRMGFGGLLRMAFDGLVRKPGRNTLTGLGVLIGVFALTMIISLSEGMGSILEGTVAGDKNLRQIGVSPGAGAGFGTRAEDVVIEGEMDDERRARMRRAAIARTRASRGRGRRAQRLNDDVLERFAGIPNVVEVRPIISDRYQVELLGTDIVTESTPTLGIQAARGQYEDRLVAGQYFTTPQSDEVVLHEYLAYQWGFITADEAASLVGRTLRLTLLENQEAFDDLVTGFLDRLDTSEMTDEQQGMLAMARQMLPALLESRDREPISRDFTIVGIGREMMPGDPFSVIEDGNAYQVDVFMPQDVAQDLFRRSFVNTELGYSRALIVADDPRNAEEIEAKLREMGWQAFSVASAVRQVESNLIAATVVLAFLTGIALLVAALGIVNTMVTSVLERTREIGLWKAVGATNGQVRVIFLMESALIGMLGGLLGLGLAVVAMVPAEAYAHYYINRESAFPFADGVFRLPLWLAAIGPTLATAVAVLAALYPAWRAARVDPVQALRHD